MCPKCDCKTKVLETRERLGTIYRKRRCLEGCKPMFWTEEIVLAKTPAILSFSMTKAKYTL